MNVEIDDYLRRYYYYCALFVLTFASSHNILAEPDEGGTTQELHYAKKFDIVDFPTHRIASVYAGDTHATKPQQYALVPRDAALPELPEDIPVIRTPVKSVVVLETIYIGFLGALNHLDAIIGAGTADYISNPTVLQRVEEGSIQKVQAGHALNVERLLLLKPDLIFTSVPSEPTLNIPTQLARAGLPVVVTAEYKEHHPLARAEWIKFIAAFFDATEAAKEIFDTTADRYETLLQKVGEIEKRPTVFCGVPYSGVWHMAGGDSYIARLIRDAGGDYLWSDIPDTLAIPLDVERVFLKAANADVWLDPGIYKNRQSLFSADPRFQKFHAAQADHIYNNTRQQTESRGNPIWENGLVHPDNVLADLIKIFHPDQMHDWNFIYYEKLK